MRLDGDCVTTSRIGVRHSGPQFRRRYATPVIGALFRGLKPTATFTLSLRDRRTGVLAAADLAGDPVQNVKHSSRFPIERKPSRGGAAGPKAWPFAASLFGPPGVETSN